VTENEIGQIILSSAMRIHTALGPGLLESAYTVCLGYELKKADLQVRQEVVLLFDMTVLSWTTCTDLTF